MSVCDQLDGTLSELASSWRCQPIDGRDTSVLVLTGRYYADGDQVSVIVERSHPDAFMLRDAGAASRLDLVGASRETSRTVQHYWDAIVEDYGCLTSGGRVYLHTAPHRLDIALVQMADTLLALDSVRHVIPPARRDYFTREVRAWLETQAELPLSDRMTVRTTVGDKKVTAIVTPEDALPVVVMAAPRSRSRLTPVEHAYFVLDQLDSREWAHRQRMTILGGSPASWKADERRALAKVGYVASLQQPRTVQQVIRQKIEPSSTDLVEFDPLQAHLL